MKHYKEVHRPAMVDQYCTHSSCDICGANCGTDENYAIYEVTVKYREGSNYPDSGWGTETEVDLCSKCFTEKLVPWLKSQGANVVAKEWDW